MEGKKCRFLILKTRREEGRKENRKKLWKMGIKCRQWKGKFLKIPGIENEKVK